MEKSFIDLKDEILRTYRVLDVNLAECQNRDDITEWFKEGLINDTTYSLLIKFNKACYYSRVNEGA